MGVMLSAAKHLAFSVTYEDEILRLSPQDDIATQSLKGKEGIRALPPVGLFIGRPIGAASNPIFEGAYEEHKGRRIF